MYQKIGKRSFNLLVLLLDLPDGNFCVLAIAVVEPLPSAIEVAAQHLGHMMSGDFERYGRHD